MSRLSTDRKPSDALAPFSAETRRWFEASFEAPTPAQAKGWPAISSGENALICAPTGSGKTLAAFLWGIDRLAREKAAAAEDADAHPGTRLVYVSPLKALSYDVEKNLRAPLRGIGADFASPSGSSPGSALRVGIRTGDTPQRERAQMLRKPPDAHGP